MERLVSLANLTWYSKGLRARMAAAPAGERLLSPADGGRAVTFRSPSRDLAESFEARQLRHAFTTWCPFSP